MNRIIKVDEEAITKSISLNTLLSSSLKISFNENRNTFTIPGFIWKLIFSFMEPKSMCRLQMVCKNFYKMLMDTSLWKSSLKYHDPEIVELLNKFEERRSNPYKDFIKAYLIKKPPYYYEDYDMSGLMYITRKSFYYCPGSRYEVYVLNVDSPTDILEDEVEQGELMKVRGEFGAQKSAETQQNTEESVKDLIKNSKKYVVLCKLVKKEEEEKDKHYGYFIQYFIGETRQMFMDGFVYCKALNSTYEGNSLLGRLEGEGFLSFKSGRKYKGNFVDGAYSGKGEYEYPGGVYKSDNWKEGNMEKGVVYWKEGGYYEGEFHDWTQSGKGVLYSNYGSVIYCDTWKEGDNTGYVTLKDSTGHKISVECNDDGQVITNSIDFRRMLNPSIELCYQSNLCTRAFTRCCWYPQFIYHCETCEMVDGYGLCHTCAFECHKGHKLIKTTPKCELGYFCDCAVKGNCSTFFFNQDYEPLFFNYIQPPSVYYKDFPEKDRKEITYKK